MKIFLTGASGFLGSHIAEALAHRGDKILAIIRKTSQIHHLKSLNLEYIEGSISDIQRLKKHLEKCDVVIHSAGLIKALSEKEFFEVNGVGTERLVEAILQCKNKPKKLVYISTIAVHNPSIDGHDFSLPSSGCHPLTDYGKSKLAGEKALQKLHGKLQTCILRPPVLYGPRDKEFLTFFKAVDWGIAPLYGSGKNRISLCYATDVAQAVIALLKTRLSSDEIFCLDDGVVYDWNQIIQTVSEVMKKKVLSLQIPPLLFQVAAGLSELASKLSGRALIFNRDKVLEMSQPNWVCGYQKLHQKTGWKPKVKLKEGALKTLRFYQKEGLIQS